MNSEFWIKKWKEGDIRFHQMKFHPQLEKYGDRFSNGTILVPLCGKSLDMLYFSSRGHKVIGVELSPIACRDFFVENGIEFAEKNTADFILFESKNINLWCGDIFKLPQKVWDEISGIYDRAALVALPLEVRQKYAAEMVNRSQIFCEVLLIAFEYPEGSYQGPPFSVPEAEIRTLYHPFKILKIDTDVQELKTIQVEELVYWLKK